MKRNVCSWIFLMASCVCTFQTTHAQINANLTPSKIKRLTTEDGLSQSSITALAMDGQGFAWLGTQDGLNRYDGREMIQFKYDPKGNIGLSGNLITTLHFDGNNKVWIGTINRGLCYYNIETGQFIVPPSNEDTKIAIERGIISHIDQDAQGRIWVNTRNEGILSLSIDNHDEIESRKYNLETNMASSSALYISNHQEIWVGTEAGEIFTAVIKKRDQLNFQKQDDCRVSGKVNCFQEVNKTLWIGSDDGIWHTTAFTPLQVRPFDLLTATNSPIRKYSVYCFVNDLENLWVGTGNGLFHLAQPEKSGSFTESTRYGEQTNPYISHNTVYSLIKNKSALWIGTASNLDIFSFKESQFDLITTTTSKALINPIVFSVCVERDNLWIGTTGGLQLFHNDEQYIFKSSDPGPNSISDDIIRSITRDVKGNLWLGTTRGVSIIEAENFDPKEPSFITLYADSDNTTTLSDDNTREVFLDTQGTIWITTQGQGINRFIGNVGTRDFRFQQFKHNPSDPVTISSNYVHSIAQNKDGAYWVGTQNGLDKLMFKDQSFNSWDIIKYRHDPLDTASLSDNSIHHVYFDGDGEMWIATRFGLNRYIEDEDYFISYHESDGLPNEVIYGLIDDTYNNIWMGTNQGLVSFNKKDNQFITYNTGDGIANEEFNILAVHRDTSGRLYFGGMEGVTSFLPEKLLNNNFESRVLISELLLPNNVNSTTASLFDQMTHITSGPSSISLNYNEFPLYIKLATPEAGPFETPDFFYKMEPHDDQWNHLEDRNEIQLLNLAPGSYTLRMASDHNGHVSQQSIRELIIQVRPPWWKSTWAWLIYALSIGGIFIWIAKLINRRRSAVIESKAIKELEESKSRFYANITHEFRTPLTVILGMTDQIQRTFNNVEERTTIKSLDMIKRNGNQLLTLVNQLLDITALRKGVYKLNWIQDDISLFVHNVAQNLESFADSKNIQLIAYIEEDQLIVDFDPNALERILTNLLSNAIKFSDSGDKVILHLKKIEAEKLCIKVKDEGKGISDQHVNRIFDRFYQVEDAMTRGAEGTGIGLSIVSEFVHLMGGTIEVKSKPGQGSEFCILLPIHNYSAHQKAELQVEPTVFEMTDEPWENNNDDAPGILIVEDNEDVAKYVASCLRDQFNIQYAANGIKGEELAINLLPDIIISDIMMPQMDGYELCRRLKTNELTSHIPIILLTARIEHNDRIKGLNCGADAYLKKPFKQDELNSRVEQLTLLRKQLKKKYEGKNFLELVMNAGSTDKELAFINKARKYIFDHLEDDLYRTPHLARDMLLSESQLYRKLKAITGKSTALFIRSIRLQHAKYLLETSELNISEVAHATGFSDPSYFSRTYKQEFNITPMESSSMIRRKNT